MMIDKNNIQKKNILVVGDAMLDTYYYGEVDRISPEAPVPVFKKNDEMSVAGGASNVAVNLVSAGQRVYMASIIGDDLEGRRLRQLLEQQDIDTELMLIGTSKTTEKIRFISENGQQVIRLDTEDTTPMPSNETDRLFERIKEKIRLFDIVVVSDYNKGLLTEAFTQSIIHLSNFNKIKVVVDVKGMDWKKYEGAYLLKPNKKELNELTGLSVKNDIQIAKAADELRKNTHCQYVLTTCGSQGMILKGSEIEKKISAIDQDVYDVTGAGDTALAYMAAGLANGIDIVDSVILSNYAAGLQVSKIGTSPVYLSEINSNIKSYNRRGNKILKFRDIKRFRWDNVGKKIVFTNGCFDILHVGHINYLKEASEMGDVLVVGLNSDESVKRLKGDSRPINNQDDRAEMLAALEFVDYIVVFEDDTPYKLINMIKPDILVKGGDYSINEIVGRDIVEANGGRVEIVPFVPGKSTTQIINKIEQQKG